MNMTDEQINIAIAEACGWEVISNTLCNVRPDKNGDPEIEPIAPLPDYLNSLDAMNEAEEFMLNNSSRRGWRGAYGNELAKVVAANGDGSWLDDFRMIRATARQRAEAFIKTLND